MIIVNIKNGWLVSNQYWRVVLQLRWVNGVRDIIAGRLIQPSVCSSRDSFALKILSRRFQNVLEKFLGERGERGWERRILAQLWSIPITKATWCLVSFARIPEVHGKSASNFKYQQKFEKCSARICKTLSENLWRISSILQTRTHVHK